MVTTHCKFGEFRYNFINVFNRVYAYQKIKIEKMTWSINVENESLYKKYHGVETPKLFIIVELLENRN